MNKQKVLEEILSTAIYYSKTLNEAVLEMYFEDLEDLNSNEVILAYKKYRKNPDNKFFPLPAQIREIVNPQFSQDDQALMLTETIFKLIRTKGYNWQSGFFLNGELCFEGKDRTYSNFDEALASYIGHENLQVVHRRGSWKSLCEEANENISGVFKKQLLDSCKVITKQNSNQLALEGPLSNILKIKGVE